MASVSGPHLNTKSGLSLLLVLFSAFRVACCVSGSLVRVRGKLWRRSHHCARKSDLPETRTSKPAPRLLRRVFSTGTPVLPSPQKPTFKLSLQSGKCVELIGDTYKAKSLSDPGTVKCQTLRNNVSLIKRNTK